MSTTYTASGVDLTAICNAAGGPAPRASRDPWHRTLRRYFAQEPGAA